MNLADMVLLKKAIPEGWIDLGLGEPYIVREVLVKTIGTSTRWIPPSDLEDLQYPQAKGDTGLLTLLQKRHQTEHIVITNGAKQALSAAFYAFRTLQKAERVYVPKPYWLSFPTLIKGQGLYVVNKPSYAQVALLTIPNNPDGGVIENSDYYKIGKIPIILDFAYNTPQYLKEYETLLYRGDVCIYSHSKKFGLSGARVGYAVCNSAEVCEKMEEFMEITTSGVSLIAQHVIEFIEATFNQDRLLEKVFYDNCRSLFEINRQIVKSINPEVLNPKDVAKRGMFAFLKKGVRFDVVAKAKVKVLEGDLFGKPGYCRLSLGVQQSVLKEAVDRINSTLRKE